MKSARSKNYLNICLRGLLVVALVVSLLPSFAIIKTSKAYAQTAEGLSQAADGISNLFATQENVYEAETQAFSEEDFLEDFNLDDVQDNSANETEAASESNSNNTDNTANNTAANDAVALSNERSASSLLKKDYHLTIRTADIRNAGFSGKISVMLSGKIDSKSASTDLHELKNTSNDNYRDDLDHKETFNIIVDRGDTNEFTINDIALDEVESVTLYTDSNNNWFCESVFVEYKVGDKTKKDYFWGNDGWVSYTKTLQKCTPMDYKIDAKTLNYPNAGSKDDAYVIIVGEKGNTGYYCIGDPDKNSHNEITFKSKDVGQIKNVLVHNNQDISLYNAGVQWAIQSAIEIVVILAT
ncbi:MAG: hypothetical protein HUJ62_08540, partial [Streptococcus gallolyticus]|nr:hypothetical protein [Streptococcus gallolyticus]